MNPPIYSVNVGNTAWEIYQSEGSSRYNVRSRNIRTGKAKFMRGYKTYEEARSVVDSKAGGSKRVLV